MTRAALAALIIATAAVAAGGGDGTSSHIREQGGVENRDGLLRTLRADTPGISGPYRLRIPFLTRDGVAGPVVVAQPTAIITNQGGINA